MEHIDSRRIDQIDKNFLVRAQSDYPFKLYGIKLATDDEWGVKVVCGYHNHMPAKQLKSHSFASQLSKKEITIMKYIWHKVWSNP